MLNACAWYVGVNSVACHSCPLVWSQIGRTRKLGHMFSTRQLLTWSRGALSCYQSFFSRRTFQVNVDRFLSLSYTLNMLFKHLIPTLTHDTGTLEKLQEITVRIVKGLRQFPYEAALRRFGLFSLPHWGILGLLTLLFKMTHGLLRFHRLSTPVPPTCQRAMPSRI